MWTLNKALLAIALLGLTQAYADGLGGGIGQNIGGGFDFDGGLGKSHNVKPTAFVPCSGGGQLAFSSACNTIFQHNFTLGPLG